MKSMYQCKTPSEVLTQEFDRRKGRNKNYSLRAYARDLLISPSRLSEVMNGSQGLSEKMALKVAEQLKLKPSEKSFWLDLILSEMARNQGVRKLAQERLEKQRKTQLLREIEEHQFRAIADWYHAAILEITQLKNFQTDPEWIAQELGLTLLETKEAIDRLKKLELLKINKDKSWEVNPEAYQAFSKSSVAIKNFQRQVIQRSAESVIHDDTSEREIQSMILAIPKKDLPKFGQKMRSFLREFWEEIDGVEKDELYSLSVQLVPVRSRTTKH